MSEQRFLEIQKLGEAAAKKMKADNRKLARLEKENARLKKKVSQLEDALQRNASMFFMPEDGGTGVDNGP